MRNRFLLTGIVLNVSLWLSSAPAAELGESAQLAVEAYKTFHTAIQESQDAQRAALEAFNAAGRTPEARDEFTAVLSDGKKLVEDSRKLFVDAFDQAGWDQFGTDHETLLGEGLFFAGYDALETDPKKSVRAFDTLLEKTPTHPAVQHVKRAFLVRAYVASNQITAGITRLEELLATATDQEKPGMLKDTGDLCAVAGDAEKARRLYELAAESDDLRTKQSVEQRLALVGLPAPDVNSPVWLAGEPKPLSELKGKIVVLDFWATWCGPCRMVMPALNELYQERNKDGLVVLGVTRQYPHGYLPSSPEQMMSGGERVSGMDEETYLDHLRTFKENTQIEYPFVVVNQEDMANFHVRGIPTVAVVGPDGKVELVAVGAGSAPMVRAVVERILNEKRG